MEEWFSVELRRICFVGREGGLTEERCVHLVRAVDRDGAFQRALQIGRDRHHEERYLNGDGDEVVWRFDRVLTIDQLGPTIEDGREIHSVFEDLEPRLSTGEALDPETHDPGMSGMPFEMPQ